MIITPPRIFNEIIDYGDHYLKLSLEISKILAEVEFYKSLPDSLKNFYPKVEYKVEYFDNKAGYRIQKIPAPDASFFYVSSDNNYDYFKKLLENITHYFYICPKLTVNSEKGYFLLNEDIIQKDLLRLELIKKLPEADELEKVLHSFGFANYDDYLKIIHGSLSEIHQKQTKYELIFSHGDMCLSNILQFQDKLYLIDPKGPAADGRTLRSPYYDYAKLSQCFNGNYDYMNLLKPYSSSMREKILMNGAGGEKVTSLFNDFCIEHNICNEYLKCIQSTLFFSMIPLHSESFHKMRAFLVKSIQSWKTRHDDFKHSLMDLN